MKKIGVVGCAGSGKTSLAEALASKLGLPMLKARDITDGILKRDGYDYSSGVQIERFLANSGRQNELLRRTIEQQKASGEFVTDRTVIDLAAYVVCEMHGSDSAAVRHIVETCRRNLSLYTHLVVCQWRDVPVEDNKRRTLNPWYQYLVHIAELGLLRDWECKNVLVLEGDKTVDRVAKVVSWLAEK